MKYDEVALISLGIKPESNPHKEELVEALEEAVYQESNYFLKRDFLPKLAEKRIFKLKPLCTLSKQLDIYDGSGIKKVINPDTFAEKDLSKLIRTYNGLVSKFKLEISRTESPCNIILFYNLWKEAFVKFAAHYCEAYEEKDGTEPQTGNFRISNIDFVELGEELKSSNYKGKARELYSVLKAQI